MLLPWFSLGKEGSRAQGWKGGSYGLSWSIAANVLGPGSTLLNRSSTRRGYICSQKTWNRDTKVGSQTNGKLITDGTNSVTDWPSDYNRAQRPSTLRCCVTPMVYSDHSPWVVRIWPSICLQAITTGRYFMMCSSQQQARLGLLGVWDRVMRWLSICHRIQCKG